MDDRADQATPARLYALVVGVALVLGGVAGFFYEDDFGTGSALVADNIIGTFPTNGWDNVLHLLIGAACLVTAPRAPRPTALAVGGALTVLGFWGLIVTSDGVGSVLDVIPVGGADNLLHLALGLAGIAAGLPSPAPGRSARA